MMREEKCIDGTWIASITATAKVTTVSVIFRGPHTTSTGTTLRTTTAVGVAGSVRIPKGVSTSNAATRRSQDVEHAMREHYSIVAAASVVAPLPTTANGVTGATRIEKDAPTPNAAARNRDDVTNTLTTMVSTAVIASVDAVRLAASPKTRPNNRTKVRKRTRRRRVTTQKKSGKKLKRNRPSRRKNTSHRRRNNVSQIPNKCFTKICPIHITSVICKDPPLKIQ